MQNNNNTFNPNSFPYYGEPKGILDYFDFCDSIVTKVTERLGSDYIITRGSIKKNNGVSYDAMTLLKRAVPYIRAGRISRIYCRFHSV